MPEYELAMQGLPDDGMQGIQPIGERRRPRLQDDGRLDLVELSISHRGNVCPARSRRHAFRSKLLAAPRADDDIRSAAQNLLWIGDDAALGKAARRPLGEDVGATGDVDEFRYPADPTDLRFVPLLEV